MSAFTQPPQLHSPQYIHLLLVTYNERDDHCSIERVNLIEAYSDLNLANGSAWRIALSRGCDPNTLVTEYNEIGGLVQTGQFAHRTAWLKVEVVKLAVDYQTANSVIHGER